MTSLISAIGIGAALCTTLSYIPQVKKIWATKRTEDLSLKTFSILAVGIALWVTYGVMQGDAMIFVGNSISLCFLAFILFYKLRQEVRLKHGKAIASPASSKPRQAHAYGNVQGKPLHGST